MKTKLLHICFFGFFLTTLILPFFLYKIDFKDYWSLQGGIIYTQKPNFTFKKYFSEEYQEQYSEYWNQHFPFRSLFVRTNNQIKYSLFNKTSTYATSKGKNEYLFENIHILSYNGYDFNGYEKIIEDVSALNRIKDSLKKYNCDLLVVFAPGKGFFFPEYIPDIYKPSNNPSNYEVYKSEIEKYNINFIDFNAWFMHQKTLSPHILYPKTGIHWSYYGMIMAVDSMAKKIEEIKSITLPKIIIDSIEVKTAYESTDTDIEDAMNLLFSIPKPPMSYPRYRVEETSNSKKPRVMVIADSFYWSIFNDGIPHKLFSDNKFLYYYKEVFPDNFISKTMVEDINMKDEIIKNDLIILLATEHNLRRFGWGFISDFSEIFNNYACWFKEKRIKYYEKTIKENESWYNLIKNKALEANIPIDSMLRRDASYMYSMEL